MLLPHQFRSKIAAVGFDYTLLPARFTSLECGDGQNDALATSAYLAAATERLKIIGAFHTAYWHPATSLKNLVIR